ncbi:preprotein translocase subunit SecB [Aquisalimonas asiatica]|uniref:Preprotein translocase subunit SecB n=2 Tax=Aquisalimonas asiatica TaxID=406100 RepID=A0A1H8S5Y9_9GAMM|nr:preprotein translocase subunit SecB [Aquisalimonas asiatica]
MEVNGTSHQESPKPTVTFAFDTTVTYLGEAAYEVILRLQVEGHWSSGPCYLCEVHQAGFFLIRGFQGRALDVVLEVNSPFQLFPYAANAANTSIRRAGFTPELPERVDFGVFFQRRRLPRLEVPPRVPRV